VSLLRAHEHRVTVAYHAWPVRGNGIWLTCTCLWEQRMGRAPTPSELWRAEQEHRRRVFEGPPVA
jgi:hypothetical protein